MKVTEFESRKENNTLYIKLKARIFGCFTKTYYGKGHRIDYADWYTTNGRPVFPWTAYFLNAVLLVENEIKPYIDLEKVAIRKLSA